LGILAVPFPLASAHDCVVYVDAESVACKCPALPPGTAYRHAIVLPDGRALTCRHGELSGGGDDGAVLAACAADPRCAWTGLVRLGDPAVDPAA
jgi:hypothetical protein